MIEPQACPACNGRKWTVEEDATAPWPCYECNEEQADAFERALWEAYHLDNPLKPNRADRRLAAHAERRGRKR